MNLNDLYNRLNKYNGIICRNKNKYITKLFYNHNIEQQQKKKEKIMKGKL